MPWPLRTPYRLERMMGKMAGWQDEAIGARNQIITCANSVFKDLNFETSKDVADRIKALADLEAFADQKLTAIQKYHTKTNADHRKAYKHDGAGSKKYKDFHHEAEGYLSEIANIKSDIDWYKKDLQTALCVTLFNEGIANIQNEYRAIFKNEGSWLDHHESMKLEFDKLAANSQVLSMVGAVAALEDARFKIELSEFYHDDISKNLLALQKMRDSELDGSFGAKTLMLSSKLLDSNREKDALVEMKFWLDLASCDDKSKYMMQMGELVCLALNREGITDEINFTSLFFDWSKIQRVKFDPANLSAQDLALDKDMTILEGRLCLANGQLDARALDIFQRCQRVDPESEFWIEAEFRIHLASNNFTQAFLLSQLISEDKKHICQAHLEAKKFTITLENFKKIKDPTELDIAYEELCKEYLGLEAAIAKLKEGSFIEDFKRFACEQKELARLMVSPIEVNLAETEALYLNILNSEMSTADSFWCDQLTIACRKLSDTNTSDTINLVNKWWTLIDSKDQSIETFHKMGAIIIQMPHAVFREFSEKASTCLNVYLQNNKFTPIEIKLGCESEDLTLKAKFKLIKDSHVMLSQFDYKNKLFDSQNLDHYLLTDLISPSQLTKLGIFNCYLEAGQHENARHFIDSLGDKDLLPSCALSYLESGCITKGLEIVDELVLEKKQDLLQYASVLQYQKAVACLDLVSRVGSFAAHLIQERLSEEQKSKTRIYFEAGNLAIQFISLPLVQKQLFANSWFVENPSLLLKALEKNQGDFFDASNGLALASMATSAIIRPIADRIFTALTPIDPRKHEQRKIKFLRYESGFSFGQELLGAAVTAEKINRLWADIIKDQGWQAMEIFH